MKLSVFQSKTRTAVQFGTMMGEARLRPGSKHHPPDTFDSWLGVAIACIKARRISPRMVVRIGGPHLLDFDMPDAAVCNLMEVRDLYRTALKDNPPPAGTITVTFDGQDKLHRKRSVSAGTLAEHFGRLLLTDWREG